MTAVANAPLMMPVQKSPWHSPVPYLFGGLAAMLGLIAFALLILACSYWKLSGYLDSGEDTAERDLESGGEDAAGDKKPAPVFEEKFLVIMAGQEKPTYLATPMSSRTSSFGSTTTSNSSSSSTSSSDGTTSERSKEESKILESSSDDQVQVSINMVDADRTA